MDLLSLYSVSDFIYTYLIDQPWRKESHRGSVAKLVAESSLCDYPVAQLRLWDLLAENVSHLEDWGQLNILTIFQIVFRPVVHVSVPTDTPELSRFIQQKIRLHPTLHYNGIITPSHLAKFIRATPIKFNLFIGGIPSQRWNPIASCNHRNASRI